MDLLTPVVSAQTDEMSWRSEIKTNCSYFTTKLQTQLSSALLGSATGFNGFLLHNIIRFHIITV